ncbi:MAG: hypothetical protein GX879_05775 [Bacteroidales bacterium]|nr:hypothetical protein [Bacteroidales bacterium]
MNIYICPKCNTAYISDISHSISYCLFDGTEMPIKTPYKKVYFRIKTPSYSSSNGFEPKDREEFNTEAINLFLDAGWEITQEAYSGRCSEVALNKQYLYLHPHHFTGAILPQNIKSIEEIINSAELFSCYKIDIYDDVYDLSDAQYLSVLEIKKNDIEKDLLELCSTKRKNLYVTSDILGTILRKHRIKRLVRGGFSYSSNDADYVFFKNVFEKLIDNGYIATSQTKNGIGYRTNTEKSYEYLALTKGENYG